ncbi:hypothetical protein [Methanoregula sp.]|uniref:hypothetical protein n=1 Tax=Methanoregula sp. TaxID=2052170 RepID=UPI003BAFE2CD
MMPKRLSRRLWVLSSAGLVCIMLLVTLASATGQATSGTLAGKTVPGQGPGQHQIRTTPTLRTTQSPQTPVLPVATSAPVATQTTDSSSTFSNPSIIAAAIGLLSAGIGAGVTLYTHAKK